MSVRSHGAVTACRFRRAIWLLAAVCVGSAAGPADADDGLARMQELERQIADSQARLENYGEQAAELRRLLERSEQRRAELRDARRRSERELARLRERQRNLAAEIRALERRIETRRAEAKRSAAWTLSLSQGGALELWLSPLGPQERRELGGTLSATLRKLREQLQGLEHDRAELAERQAETERLAAEQQQLTARLQAQMGETTARAEQQQRSLAMIRRDEALTRGMLDDLEGARRELARIIARTRSGRAELLPFEPWRGRMQPPIDGGRVLLAFGRQRDPVFEVEIEHPGWTLRVDRGTPTRAVAQGEVAYAGWLRGYGNLVVLQHGGEFFTLYGHLDEILVAKGDNVREGVPIGLSGDSGSMYGPVLHFEIRHRREALNPAEWIARDR